MSTLDYAEDVLGDFTTEERTAAVTWLADNNVEPTPINIAMFLCGECPTWPIPESAFEPEYND